MNKKYLKVYLAVLMLVISHIAFAQGNKIKKWSRSMPLIWDDYRGKVDTNSPFASKTYCSINYHYNFVLKDGNYTFDFIVDCLMNQDLSWSVWSRETDILLKHEQLHFDLTEFCARDLLKELRRTKFSGDFKNQISSIVNKNNIQRITLEDLYDSRTGHSSNTDMQRRWTIFTESLLKNGVSLSYAIQHAP